MKNMPASRYTDKHIFEQEQRSLFRRHWQLFCHAAQLKDHGDYVSGDIAGMAVIAIRGNDGELRAFLNVCRHRGAQLLEPGTGNCDTLRCPYHNWIKYRVQYLVGRSLSVINIRSGLERLQYRFFRFSA